LKSRLSETNQGNFSTLGHSIPSNATPCLSLSVSTIQTYFSSGPLPQPFSFQGSNSQDNSLSFLSPDFAISLTGHACLDSGGTPRLAHRELHSEDLRLMMLGPITSTPCSLSFPQAIAPVPVLLLFPHLPHLASPSSFACACVLTLPVPFRCQIFLPPASPQELATDTGDTLLSHNHAIGTSLPFGATFDMAHYTHSAPFSHKGTEPSVITSNLFQGANSSTPDPAPPSPLSEFAASSIPQPCISVIVDFGPSIASGPGHMDVSDFDSSDYPSLDSEDNLEQDVVPPLPMHHTLLELPLPDSPLPSMSAFVSATQTPTALQHAINRSSQVSSTSFYTAPCTRDSKPPSLRSSLAATLGQTDAQGSTTSPITLLPPLLKARHKISIS